MLPTLSLFICPTKMVIVRLARFQTLTMFTWLENIFIFSYLVIDYYCLVNTVQLPDDFTFPLVLNSGCISKKFFWQLIKFIQKNSVRVSKTHSFLVQELGNRVVYVKIMYSCYRRDLFTTLQQGQKSQRTHTPNRTEPKF